ncbi:MAG: hypothetical protein JWM66_713 [Solirubrobacterales bacterium]|nr:hypothetical protein [Solirubrobacterales bacterium]
MAGAIVVTALSTTPVKGLRIDRRERVVLDRAGANGDRRFYLIDDRGRMINGKHAGALNTISAELSDDGQLTLAFSDGEQVAGPTELGDTVATSFFSHPRAARLVLGPFSDALSRHAGESLRLVRSADGSSAIDRGTRGAVSLVSRASLAQLAEVAGEESVDGRRFRMTVEIDGVQPFGEDAWVERELLLGDALVRIRGHVGRCIVTSRDPLSGEIDLPTLDLLRSFREGAATSEPLAFGVYGEVLTPGAIALGDEVRLTG